MEPRIREVGSGAFVAEASHANVVVPVDGDPFRGAPSRAVELARAHA